MPDSGAIVVYDKDFRGSGHDALAGQRDLQVIHDSALDKWLLFDPRTHKLVVLIPPPQGESWELDLNEEGWAMVCSDSESHWANSFLSYDAYQAAGHYCDPWVCVAPGKWGVIGNLRFSAAEFLATPVGLQVLVHTSGASEPPPPAKCSPCWPRSLQQIRSAPKSLCCSKHTHTVWAKLGRKRLGEGDRRQAMEPCMPSTGPAARRGS